MIHLLIASAAFVGLFLLFMVLSKTLNNIVNQFIKLEYFLGKEYDLQKEIIAIHRVLREDAARAREEEAQSEEHGSPAAPTSPPAGS